MRTLTGIDDLESLVGQHLGTSEWVDITQERIDAFAEATGDHQWIHVDPERAKEGPFGTTIAHGYLTLSLLPLFYSTVYRVEGVRMGINYGANKVRFLTPVPVGSRLRGSIEVGEVTRVPNGGAQVTLNVTVELEGSDKPACYAEAISVMYT
ncbi:dehydratase [Nostocoides sp. F2B08]|uniref:MaoC family dehydratase n=1 Tax=Nostocoides sp. F2B08 TaxID=2653936 RepID=UPI00126345F2|nr:MaoC family dehydratase [Tetrasphaera sp. F2B08]KAB7743482.1 dehydratase [Tetrasphaera sp. F2B08]